MQDPAFRGIVQGLRRQMLVSTVAKLTTTSGQAADVLQELLSNKLVEPKVRLGAATAVFRSLIGLADLATHGDQIRQILDRLDEMARDKAVHGKSHRSAPHKPPKSLPDP
jgi:hypothetical protein